VEDEARQGIEGNGALKVFNVYLWLLPVDIKFLQNKFVMKVKL